MPPAPRRVSPDQARGAAGPQSFPPAGPEDLPRTYRPGSSTPPVYAPGATPGATPRAGGRRAGGANPLQAGPADEPAPTRYYDTPLAYSPGPAAGQGRQAGAAPMSSRRSRAAQPGDSRPAQAAYPSRGDGVGRSSHESGLPTPGYGIGRDRRRYTRRGKRKHRLRRAFLTLLLVIVLLLAWPVGLAVWANQNLTRVDALSGAIDTPGTTYLIAGSDQRGSGGIDGDVKGARSDTIMLLNVPPSGRTSLMSLPRDSYVQIPGHGRNKLNAAYSIGGPKLLVKTVEKLTGLTVDHYIEVGFGSVVDLVDAVGGVRLCLDQNVKDSKSKLTWSAGCHEADGATALAFSRERYADALGDIGRASRQRQVVSALAKKVMTPSLLVNPSKQLKLVKAGTGAVTVDRGTNIVDLARAVLAFKAATGSGGATGTPTIESMGYNPGGGVGSCVELDAQKAQQDFRAVEAGTWKGNDKTGGEE
ncbi:MAG: LCP family protein [Bifidobacteriaceae bacterium]|nr:LCP family protein [Bifidobacteriaceae bacterium]